MSTPAQCITVRPVTAADLPAYTVHEAPAPESCDLLPAMAEHLIPPDRLGGSRCAHCRGIVAAGREAPCFRCGALVHVRHLSAPPIPGMSPREARRWARGHEATVARYIFHCHGCRS